MDLKGRDFFGQHEIRIGSYHWDAIKNEAPSAAESRAG